MFCVIFTPLYYHFNLIERIGTQEHGSGFLHWLWGLRRSFWCVPVKDIPVRFEFREHVPNRSLFLSFHSEHSFGTKMF
jgi:hypothetical protein